MPEHPNILLADAELKQRRLMEVLLSNDDYELAMTTDGAGVLTHVRGHTPDLIVLDVDLPDLSGIDLCERIKNVSRLKDTPVVLVTARKDERLKAMAEWVRADKILEKPLSSTGFRDVVARLLDKATADGGAPTQPGIARQGMPLGAEGEGAVSA